MKVHVLHYINQFFGQIGGEEKAGVGPRAVDGPVGPGLLIDRLLRDRGRVVATLICGDNYFAENMEAACEELSAMIVDRHCDIFIAGPAFNAGRYGIACGEMTRIVSTRFGLPAVTGMFPDNPGVDLYRKKIYIVETGGSAAGMANAMPKMVDLAMKLATGVPIGRPGEDGYIPRGIKQNVATDRLAAQRAIDMLLLKVKGMPFRTEISFPHLDVVPPARPIADLKEATIALVTEGGLVPKDNPDGLESARATKWGKYSIDDLASRGASGFRSVHRGFDTTFVNEDPNRLLPVDVMKDFEAEGVVRKLFPSYFVTTGVATSTENARRIGKEMARDLASSGVSGIILTSTWGTGTRCGAVLEREFERAGIPAVLITALLPTARAIKVNRVVPGTGITNPVGDPRISPSDEKKVRRKIVAEALAMLTKDPRTPGPPGRSVAKEGSPADHSMEPITTTKRGRAIERNSLS